jgi:hypothetical protein
MLRFMSILFFSIVLSSCTIWRQDEVKMSWKEEVSAVESYVNQNSTPMAFVRVSIAQTLNLQDPLSIRFSYLKGSDECIDVTYTEGLLNETIISRKMRVGLDPCNTLGQINLKDQKEKLLLSNISPREAIALSINEVKDIYNSKEDVYIEVLLRTEINVDKSFGSKIAWLTILQVQSYRAFVWIDAKTGKFLYKTTDEKAIYPL